jgi:hypothetical protein
MNPVRRPSHRRSRQFHPGADLSLEARIALSTFGHHASAAHAQFSRTPATPNILAFFPTAAAGLAAGNQVYEQWSATYYDGLSQTDNETFALKNQTVTVTENITLRGGAGTETAVDHYTAIPGGVLFQNALTLPNGQTVTETRTDTIVGTHEIIRNGSIARPDGVTITFATTAVEQGTKTTANSTFRESNGITYTVHEVDVNYSPFQSSATVTTKWPDGSHQVNKNTVSGQLLSAPPS